MSDTSIIIYHNPACGTSRNTLALIRNSGVEPAIIHYLETPPSRETLVARSAAMGMPVRVTLDALPKQPFAGHVRRVAPYVLAVEKQARTVDVEVDFDEPAKQLLVGYSADVEIVLQQKNDVLRVPTAAIMEGGRVLLLNPDTGDKTTGQLAERKLKTGLANWEYTEVLDGLTRGDRVVMSLERAGVKVGARVTAEVANQSAKAPIK